MTPEDRFKEMISGMYVHSVDVPKLIRYYKDGKYLICQNVKTGMCFVDYWKIWSVLSSEYRLNYQEVKVLTTALLKQHLKHGVETTGLK